MTARDRIAAFVVIVVVIAVWKFIDWRMQPPPPPNGIQAAAATP